MDKVFRSSYIIFYLAFISLSAQISFDLNFSDFSIPITGQTMALLTGAAFLSPRETLIGVSLYCLLGVIGLPIFSDGNAGWSAFSGNSLGYFIGFIIASTLASFSVFKMQSITFLNIAWTMTWATLLILICGTTWLSSKFGISSAIENGFTPFLLGGVVKILLGTALVLLIEKMGLLKVSRAV